MMRTVRRIFSVFVLTGVVGLPIAAPAQERPTPPPSLERPMPPPSQSTPSTVGGSSPSIAAMMTAIQAAMVLQAAAAKTARTEALTNQQLIMQAALDQAAKARAQGQTEASTSLAAAAIAMSGAAISLGGLTQKQLQGNHAVVVSSIGKSEQSLEDEMKKSAKSPNAADRTAVTKSAGDMSALLAAEKIALMQRQNTLNDATSKATDQLLQAQRQKFPGAPLAQMQANEVELKANQAELATIAKQLQAIMDKLHQAMESYASQASPPPLLNQGH